MYEAEDPTVSGVKDKMAALGDGPSDRLEREKKEEPESTERQKKKKKKLDMNEFNPYDYNKADTSIFQG